MTYVYVVETDCYNQRDIGGVFASPEAAMVAHPIPADPQTDGVRPAGWAVSWTEGDEPVEWYNGCDWGDTARIRRFELLAVNDEAAPTP